MHFLSRGGRLLPLLWLMALGVGCQDSPQPPAQTEPVIAVPVFQADSAYAFIAQQVAFGPRVPNSAAHRACGDWLIDKLAGYGAAVQVQEATVRAFDGTPLAMRNIIARFGPEKNRRVLLSAHWDTRPFADEDSSRQQEPIPGANDGGSGVGVLLEVARHLYHRPPAVGVDIILWDAEDYGSSEHENSYCLGSQYWSRKPHQPGYRPLYGINLDMVGAAGAYFTREGISEQYARPVLDKVWKQARALGHDTYFRSHSSEGIIDDHTYLNLVARIPTIDIIDRPAGEQFFPHWHTHRDDLDIISTETLQAVGETVMAVVYHEQ